MRVLMLVRLYYPQIGGAERQAQKLAVRLREKNVETRVVTGWWSRRTPQRETLEGVPIFRNHTLWNMFDIKGLRKFAGFVYMASLAYRLWRERDTYDVIHIHSLSYHTFAAARVARRLGRPTLVKLANSGTASDIDKMRGNRHMPLTHRMLAGALACDRLVATNATIARELIRAGVPEARIERLANGVEVDAIAARSETPLGNPVRLLFVGRLHEQKGADVLLRAFERLSRRRSDLSLQLDLVGDGPRRRELEAIAGQLGIADRVAFVGETDRVEEYLRAADIFILPSRAEGISNALLEAMAHALPVVVSRIPGNVDVVSDGANGLLFDVDDPAALEQTLSKLLTDRALRERLGRSARTTVEREYSLDAVAERYIALYRNLLDANENTPS